MPSKPKSKKTAATAADLEAVLGAATVAPAAPVAAATEAVEPEAASATEAPEAPAPKPKSKPKTKKTAAATPAGTAAATEAVPVEDAQAQVAPPKKKSGGGSRAKAAAAATATEDANVAPPASARNEHVILQLQVPTPDSATAENAASSFETTFYRYDSILSTPNAFDEYNPFDSQPCLISDETYQTSQHDITMDAPAKTATASVAAASVPATASGGGGSKRKETLMGPKTFDHMRDFMQRDEWPSTTNIVCFWCCHSFHNVPYGVPTKYVDEKFFVAGCFCSLECAAASIFYSQEIKHDTWSSYHLLNILARKLGYKALVKVAPPRTCLKMFGGYMDIADFRHYSETHKVIHSHSYPMVATIQQLEEVNDHENYSHRKSMYVPVDRQKLYLLENKIRLERNKPLLNSKNTLDYRMNLRLES